MRKLAKKLATLLMFTLSLSMLIGGVVFADPTPTVNVTVVDTQDKPVTTVKNGDHVTVAVNASGGDSGAGTGNTAVEIKTNPNHLQMDTANAVMSNNSGATWLSNSDPYWGGFLSQDPTTGTWYWEPAWLNPDYPSLGPNTLSMLRIPALVTNPIAETIKVTTTLGNVIYGPEGQVTFEEVFDTAEYTFNATVPTNNTVEAKTVPMQKTGFPIIPLAGALLTIASGLLAGMVLRE